MFPLLKMATLRNKKKLAAIIRENHEEQPRNSQAGDTKIQEDYVTQVSEKVEGRWTKKLSQEFSRAESHFLGAISKIDEILLNPNVRVHSDSILETSRKPSRENQDPTEDHSQNDLHREARIFLSQSSQEWCPDDADDNFLTVKKIDSIYLKMFWRVNKLYKE